MRQPTITDYSLLVFLAVIWASAFFNIKLATDSFGPITIAFIRVLLGLKLKNKIKRAKIAIDEQNKYR